MDLVFKRYSSPFLLLDNIIENGKFLEFVLELIDTYNEEQIYDLWLHKCYDKSYQEFKKSIIDDGGKSNVQAAEMDDEQITSIINDSYEMLNNFKPC